MAMCMLCAMRRNDACVYALRGVEMAHIIVSSCFMYIFSMSVFFHFLCHLLCQGEQLVAIAFCNPFVK